VTSPSVRPGESAGPEGVSPARNGAAPSGTVTFLFTDIEGSTRLWEEYPKAMKTALAVHDEIIRGEVEANGGFVFKTVGDAFWAAFRIAPDALQAAIDAQRKLHAQDWSAVGRLRVRMALHTGAAEERSGDYYGPTLDRVNGLLSAGHGGQTLLSLPTVELLRDQKLPGVDFLDMGVRRLRDLLHKEHVFQLALADLPRDYPPLRTMEGRPNNLPARTTPLVGREKEVKVCRDLLRRSDVRLLTLVGPGGSGKTRLGLHVAAELLDDFKDGVFVVSLAPVTDPALVASTIAQTLGIREAGGQKLVASLKDYLRDKQMLLMLDNFEQVLEAAPLVWELLAGAPQLKVLVTSRAALQISAEQEYQIPPMTMPGRSSPLPPLDALSQFDAVALFIRRAMSVKPDFTMTNENAPAIAEICARLDGLPLAIELAAARIKILPPQAMLARLTNRLSLLTGGARDLPARQQTMRATIEWSYDLLEPGEQALYRRLCVFAGGCSLEAAEAIAGEGAYEGGGWEGSGQEAVGPHPQQTTSQLDIDVLDGISSLVNKSLLRQLEESTGEPRFSMLETIREYGLERLAESGEEAAIHRRHALFFLQMAEDAEKQLRGPRQREYLDRLEQEHDNLRAALGWTIEGREGEVGPRLAGALWRFWYMRSYLTEGSRWLLAAIGLPAETAPPAVRARVLIGAGNLIYNQGDYRTARALHEQSLAISTELGDRQAQAISYNSLGLIARGKSEYDRARTLLEQALEINRELGNRNMQALNLNNLANVLYDQGDFTKARTLQEESLALFTSLRDEWGIAMALSDTGKIVFEQGDYAAARQFYERGLELQRELGDGRNVADTLNKLGVVALNQSDYSQACWLFQQSLTAFRELGDKRGIASSLHNLGKVDFRQGDFSAARSNFEQALMLREELGDSRDIGDTLNNLGLVALARADYDKAQALLEDTLDKWRQAGNKALVPTALSNLGLVAINKGEFDRAVSLLEEALAMFRESGEKLGVAFALLNMGHAISGRGDYDEARPHYEQSLKLFGEFGDRLHIATCLARLSGLYALTEQPERAARLAGAVNGLLEALGVPLPPFERPYYEPAIAAARARLGKERFSAASDAGRALTLEQAIAEGMAGAEC
jgi:predicted ATPase/class 3 adenylate cyclase/Tfp pilus assembly protein PilF